jgi:hypothetical protein
MRRIGGRLLKRLDDHALDIVVADRSRCARPQFVMQTIQSMLNKPPAPLPDCGAIDAQPLRDRDVRPARCAGQQR